MPSPKAASFTCRSESIDMPSITAPPIARNMICLIIAMVCGSVMCIDRPGIAASAST